MSIFLCNGDDGQEEEEEVCNGTPVVALAEQGDEAEKCPVCTRGSDFTLQERKEPKKAHAGFTTLREVGNCISIYVYLCQSVSEAVLAGFVGNEMVKHVNGCMRIHPLQDILERGVADEALRKIIGCCLAENSLPGQFHFVFAYLLTFSA